ncbi:permease [bacterium]|nr:permease [bacterium]
MKKNVIPLDFKMAFILFFTSFVLLQVFHGNFLIIIKNNVGLINKTMGLTVIATLISSVIHFLIPVSYVEQHLRQNKLKYFFYATILGILTPGPVYAIYPIVIALKKKGITEPLLVCYITGQTIIGPARIPFELGFFGLEFFLYRVILSLLMGPLCGWIFLLLSTSIKKPVDN